MVEHGALDEALKGPDETEHRKHSFRSKASTPASSLRPSTTVLLTEHVIPDLKDASFSVWLCCCIAVTLPAAMTLLITSDLSPLGRQAFSRVWFLNDVLGITLSQAVNNQIPSGIKSDKIGYLIFYTLAGVGYIIGFLVDVIYWRFVCLKVIYIMLFSAALLIGVVLHAESFPWLWIIIGVSATMLNLTALRKYCFSREPDFRAFNFIVAAVLLLHSLVLGVIWVLWAFSPWLGYHTYADGLADGTAVDGTALTYVFLWLSPAILSTLYFICALFIFARIQFHIPEEGALHVGGGDDNVYVGAELKFALYCLIFVACLIWIGVAVAGLGAGLTDMVMHISGAMFFLIALYIFIPIGPERIMAAASEHEWIKYVLTLMTNDWMKAIIILFMWPAIPLYFFVGFIHQMARKMMGCCRLIEAPGGTCCLNELANQRKRELEAWDWASVLPKSIAAGICYFTLQVGASLGTTIFLSWLAEAIRNWPMAAICGVIFAVGLTMFLIPVVPGLPIYLVAGIVVVQRCKNDNIDTIYGALLASVLCWVIKLTSNVVLMKFVGEPYADNVNVKMMVGTHTPTMKAAALILTEPGLTVPKVAVLVGGPDWPTAVICSMLKVPVCSMLVGTSPVMILIIPVVLAASYTLEAGLALNDGHEEEAAWKSKMSSIMMAASAAGQMGSMVVAGLYIQATKKTHAEHINEERPEDNDVLDAVKSEERSTTAYLRKTAWSLMPCWLKFLLFLGSFASCAMMHIVLSYFVTPFRSFALTDSICDPKGLDCNPLNVVRDPGWLSIIFLGFAIFCQAVCSIWCKCTATDSQDGSEIESLTAE